MEPRARKSLGQHFLTDPRVADRIVAALAIRPGEPVLEIGPGRGALTGRLIAAADRIAAVELDAALALTLEQRFGERIMLRREDVLRSNVAAWLSELAAGSGARWVVAGNLPYNISKPIAQLLIRERASIDRAVLMFQREVARRLTAGPGSRDYGPLSVIAGQSYDIEVLFDVPPAAFRPQPAVHSSVTVWRPRDGGTDTQARLRACLAVCFARRRQTLRNNLRAALPDERTVDALLERADLDGSLRAEVLPPAAFLRLAAEWPVEENRSRER